MAVMASPTKTTASTNWPCVGSTRISPSLTMEVASVSAYISTVCVCVCVEWRGGVTTCAFKFVVARQYCVKIIVTDPKGNKQCKK